MPVHDAIQNKDITYNILYDNGFSHLEDQKSKQVSDFVHDFTVLEIIEVNGIATRYLLGTTGSTTRFYSTPKPGNQYFKPIGSSFHSVTYRSDLGGIFVAQLGACSYILDENCNFNKKNYYHRIFMHKGSLFGDLGSRTVSIQSRMHMVLNCHLTRIYKG